ncbi:MAG: ABC transporter ATP-binding protein [Deltaproteobacteria bacterium]|nr:ABC transporter ATP-binding protein [Deltaproteobacteria bacterium]
MSEMLLECRGLIKEFRAGRWRKRIVQALRGVNLSVRRGDVYGFLGKNGAGKTTTVRCMLGMSPITDGQVVVFGHDNPPPEYTFRRISYCPEDSNFFTGLTGRELLTIYGRLNGMPKAALRDEVQRVLELVGVAEAADRRMTGYSKGMRQRIGLAQAILPSPELIILDEPARGLDPVGRRRFRDVINDLAAKGTTFFINSHTLSEVERTCNRVGIIKDGLVVRELTPDDLVLADQGLEVRYALEGEPLAESRPADRMWSLTVTDTHGLAEASAEIARRGGQVESVDRRRQSLEDYFIQVVGENEVVE